jgi:S-DNA-T family DNA segregation ATPase FtsK/SpoIIIE
MQGASLHNPAGRGGAWLADLLLYVFGLSAWWWIVLLIAVVWWGYRRLDGLRTAIDGRFTSRWPDFSC